MTRARNIKPGFFENEILGECNPYARLLYIGLWMMADREGRLEDRPKRIKARILPYNDIDCNALLEELILHQFIIRYQVAGEKYIFIPAFEKHQNPHKNEKGSELPAYEKNDALHECIKRIDEATGCRDVNNHPENDARYTCRENISTLDTLHEELVTPTSDTNTEHEEIQGIESPVNLSPVITGVVQDMHHTNRADSLNPDSLNPESNKPPLPPLDQGEEFVCLESQSENRKKKKRPGGVSEEVEKQFEEFWKTYGKKVDRTPALKAFAKALKGGAHIQDIMAGGLSTF